MQVAEWWLGRTPREIDVGNTDALKALEAGDNISYEEFAAAKGEDEIPAKDSEEDYTKFKLLPGEELMKYHARVGNNLLRKCLQSLGSLLPVEQAMDF
eukprot:1844698-Alexandrium_andersonii.AAC.1